MTRVRVEPTAFKLCPRDMWMMDVRSRRVFLAALAVIVIGSVLTPAALADSHEYRISVDGSVPIPEQTKKIDESGVEGEFVFSAIRAADPGEQFTVAVSGVSGGDNYRLRVEEFTDGGELRVRDFSNMNGNDETTIGAPDSPGLYFLSAYTDNYESLYPLIIEEYDVDVDADEVPNVAEVGSEISIRADITRSVDPGPEDRQQIQYVDVVIANEETLENKTLKLVEKSETSFTVSGSITINENVLNPGGGPYSLYVAARGPEMIEGLRVPVGISEQRTLEVTEPSTPTATPSPTETPTPSTEATRSPTETPTASPTLTPTPPTTTGTTEGTSGPTTASDTPTDTDSPDTLPTLRPPNGTLQPKNEATPTDTGDGILTPGGDETESPGGETSTDGQPGFAVAAVVLAIIITATLLRRR
jgi:hypothetical protein